MDSFFYIFYHTGYYAQIISSKYLPFGTLSIYTYLSTSCPFFLSVYFGYPHLFLFLCWHISSVFIKNLEPNGAEPLLAGPLPGINKFV